MAEDTKKYLWPINRFHGGEAEDDAMGPYAGFAEGSIGFEIHDKIGQLQVANLPVVDDGGVIAKTIKWMEYVPSQAKTFLYGGDTIYQESAGTYTSIRSIAAGTPNGQGMAEFDGIFYYRTGTTLGTFDFASTWNDSWQTGLQSQAEFAPLQRFKALLLVANGRYLGTVDDVGTWNATRLTFPPGYNVRSITVAGKYAAIVVMRGETIASSDEGFIFFWDGTSEAYNFFTPLDGNPQAATTLNNMVQVITGDQPVLYESAGGQPKEMFVLPNVGIGKTAEVWPGAICTWRGRVYFGISDGTSTTVQRVVREWGSKNSSFDLACNPIYPISTGHKTGTTVQITALAKVGNTLRIAWKDDTDYGVDEVSLTTLQASATYRSLIFDRESPYLKTPDRVVVELITPLVANESVTIKLGRDPYGDPAFADSSQYASITVSTVGKKRIVLPLRSASVPIKSTELKLEITPGGTAATKPKIKRVWTEFSESKVVMPD